MKHPESQIQQAVIRWFALAHRGLGIADPRLLMAIPNGGARNIVTATRLKAEGVRRGVPDLFLAHPTRWCAGLWIEMKAGKAGRVREEQKVMLSLLHSARYGVAVCRSFEEAVATIQDYVGCRGAFALQVKP